MKKLLCFLFLMVSLFTRLPAQTQVYSLQLPQWETRLSIEAGQSAEDFLRKLEHYPNKEVIRILDMRACGLETLPDWLQAYGNLEVLILRENPIRRLPLWLPKLRQLHTLSLSHLPRGKRLPGPRLYALKEFTLANSGLKRLPRFIRRKYPQLEKLYLEENAITHIRRRLSPSLLQLDLSYNPLQLNRQKPMRWAQLESLRLNFCQLDTLPDFWPRLTRLKSLQLAGNRLHYLPNSLLRLHQLEELSLYKNQLQALPDSLGRLQQLKVLDLYFNELRYLPESLGRLDKLEILYVANNQLIELPEALGELRNLKELYAHHNRLTYLPARLQQLKQVEVLRLNKNALQQFPIEVLDFPHLRELDLAFNQIRELPENLLEHPPARELSIQQNPLEAEARLLLNQLEGQIYLLNY